MLSQTPMEILRSLCLPDCDTAEVQKFLRERLGIAREQQFFDDVRVWENTEEAPRILLMIKEQTSRTIMVVEQEDRNQ